MNIVTRKMATWSCRVHYFWKSNHALKLRVQRSATVGKLKQMKSDVSNEKSNADTSCVYLKVLANKNPRNLEYLAIAPKPKGFKTQRQRVDYYYRLVLETSNRHVYGYVSHQSGVKIVQASTREFGLVRHLYKTNDVSASYHIGQLVVARLKEVGLSNVMWEVDWTRRNYKKVVAFLKAITKGGIKLEEPRQRKSIPVHCSSQLTSSPDK